MKEYKFKDLIIVQWYQFDDEMIAVKHHHARVDKADENSQSLETYDAMRKTTESEREAEAESFLYLSQKHFQKFFLQPQEFIFCSPRNFFFAAPRIFFLQPSRIFFLAALKNFFFGSPQEYFLFCSPQEDFFFCNPQEDFVLQPSRFFHPSCHTIECNLSIRFCVIFCRRFGSRIVIRHGSGACTVTRLRFWCLQSMSVVDTRLLGRPSTFGGAEAEWPDWAFSMRAY